MRETIAVIVTTFSLGAAPVTGQQLSAESHLILEEGFRLMTSMENRWTDWASAPRAVLLVDDEYEFLVGHSHPSDDFRPSETPPVGEWPVFVRERTMSPNLLATFPAIGGVPTIVIGTPENTGLGPTRWIFTLLHEHFHQFQMSRPGYFTGVEALDLSGGDETGMWMLNYPFPYDEASVSEGLQRLGVMARGLAENARGGATSPEAVLDYRETRAAVAEGIRAPDYRYLAFQLWQEGVARFAELDAASHASGRFEPSSRFRGLPGFVPVHTVADELWNEIRVTSGADPSQAGRSYFYALGALEAAALDAARPGWRDSYNAEAFDLGGHWARR